MSSICHKIVKVVICTSVLFILTGCSSHSFVNAEPTKRAAWLAYWDLASGEKELVKIGGKLEKLSYFGAYFDKNDCVFIPKELSDRKNKHRMEKRKYETYLTFVNDKQNSDGTVVLKDIEVLRRLFCDDTSMDKHIDEIIALTLQGGYDGIEIDYERIWKEEKIGQSFLRFANKLYVKALKNNLKLRLVLEPSTSFSSAGFFEGPEYVVMLYNLYGLHSSPGPKANKEFIKKTVKRMEGLPGEKTAAFSTGGCVWSSKGEKRFLTEVEAKSLALRYGLETKRDEPSQCIVFEYIEMGVLYQVWYADVKTLNYWISITKEQGINSISVWRFGGNIDIDKII